MNLEPRTVELSRSNFESAIETFLRATDVIKDSETPRNIMAYDHGEGTVRIVINFEQQEETEQTVKTITVH